MLNLAVVKSNRWDVDLAANAEATGLLMAHCRNATALLHCSSTGVYQPAGLHPLVETDPLGDNHRVIMETYSIAKIAAEAVVRTEARQLDLPTTIARLNVPYGDNGGWPAFHLAMIEAGQPVPVHPDRPNRFNPIHEDDIIRMIPRLLEIASVPATIVNWGGSEPVDLEEWCDAPRRGGRERPHLRRDRADHRRRHHRHHQDARARRSDRGRLARRHAADGRRVEAPGLTGGLEANLRRGVVVGADRAVVLEVTLLELDELLVGTDLDVHEVVVGLRHGADQLVELQLHRALLAALRVLDHEHHDRRDAAAARGERGLPRLGEPGDREGDAEPDDDPGHDDGRARA